MDRRRFGATVLGSSLAALGGCLDAVLRTDSVSHRTITFPPSFVADMTFSVTDLAARRVSGTLRFDREDFLLELLRIELYRIDGTSYLVTGPQCIRNPAGISQQVEPGSAPTRPDSQRDLLSQAPGTPDRRETVDGQELLVYVIENESDSGGPTTTVWVSEETGYPHRTESDKFSIDYHSHEEELSLSKPEMDCAELGSDSG